MSTQQMALVFALLIKMAFTSNLFSLSDKGDTTLGQKLDKDKSFKREKCCETYQLQRVIIESFHPPEGGEQIQSLSITYVAAAWPHPTSLQGGSRLCRHLYIVLNQSCLRIQILLLNLATRTLGSFPNKLYTVPLYWQGQGISNQYKSHTILRDKKSNR